jgi:hypothetical protein
VVGDDTPAGGGNSGGFGPFNDMMTTAGLFNAPHVDARRGALNTNDLRGKLLRITVKDGAIASGEANQLDGAYTVPAGNLFPQGQAFTRPEVRVRTSRRSRMSSQKLRLQDAVRRCTSIRLNIRHTVAH